MMSAIASKSVDWASWAKINGKIVHFWANASQSFDGIFVYVWAEAFLEGEIYHESYLFEGGGNPWKDPCEDEVTPAIEDFVEDVMTDAYIYLWRERTGNDNYTDEMFDNLIVNGWKGLTAEEQKALRV